EPMLEDNLFRPVLRSSRWFSGRDKDVVPGQVRLADVCGVIASLCPTLDVRVMVRIGSDEPIQLLQPHDWLSLDQRQLLSRIYARSFFSRSEGTLVELKTADGAVIGRISHSDSSSGYAAITNGGLRNGAVPRL